MKHGKSKSLFEATSRIKPNRRVARLVKKYLKVLRKMQKLSRSIGAALKEQLDPHHPLRAYGDEQVGNLLCLRYHQEKKEQDAKSRQKPTGPTLVPPEHRH